MHAQAQRERERERELERESSSVWICAILIYSVVSSKQKFINKKERQARMEKNKHRHKRATGDFWAKTTCKNPHFFSKVRVWKDTHEQR